MSRKRCYAIEDGAPAKQLKRVDHDIIFRNRDTDEVETPTFGSVVIVNNTRPKIINEC